MMFYIEYLAICKLCESGHSRACIQQSDLKVWIKLSDGDADLRVWSSNPGDAVL